MNVGHTYTYKIFKFFKTRSFTIQKPKQGHFVDIEDFEAIGFSKLRF
jgi:hypothetical protein